MTNFNELAAFVIVVREGSFTRAAAQLRLSPSALSHSMRNLEERLTIKLLNRTTRSVSPTEAGERLYQSIATQFQGIEDGLTTINEMRDKVSGKVRISATESSFNSIIWPKLSKVLHQYPDIQIEINSDYRFTNIVAERYDIGVRLGDDVEKDMIAVRIASDMKMVVVGSPHYLNTLKAPQIPQQLIHHQCICLRLPTYGGLLPWEFMMNGRLQNIKVTGSLIFNTSSMVLQAAVDGYGLAWLPENIAEPYIDDHRLVSVLDDYAASFTGYHLYYATRNASPAIKVIVEALRLKD